MMIETATPGYCPPSRANYEMKDAFKSPGDNAVIQSAPPYATLNGNFHFKAKDVENAERMLYLGPFAQKCHQS